MSTGLGSAVDERIRRIERHVSTVAKHADKPGLPPMLAQSRGVGVAGRGIGLY